MTLQSQKGTVLLVALCFVTVLGISLAGYIAVCSRTMQLSNRTTQTGLSEQLAEMGIEEALRAFNKNSWSSWPTNPTSSDTVATWAISGTTATCTITFPNGKFGQGVTGSVKIRIDNYNSAQLNSTWNNSTSYRIGDLVGHLGIWYRCVKNNSGSTPTLSPGFLNNWVPEPIPWSWRSQKSYVQNVDIVCFNGEWYRCNTSHTSGTSFSGASWTWMAAPQLVMLTSTFYWQNQYVYRTTNNTWYRSKVDQWVTGWVGANWEEVSGSVATTPYLPWAYRTSATYSFNDVVYYNDLWYRFIYATPTSGKVPGSDPAYWQNALSGEVHSWGSGINYNLGDVVYFSGTAQWYRCILAHTSTGVLTPTNAALWTNSPLRTLKWDSNRQYIVNDTVTYNGIWYRCLVANNASNPSTNATNWASADNSAYYWNPTTPYTNSSYVSYGGVWYDCTTSNTGQSPNNSDYWTAMGASVVYAEGTVNIAGSPAIKTQLRATLAPAPLFPNAVASGTTISATNGGTIDSYDSVTNPDGSNHGSNSTGYSAVVAAAGTITLSGTTVKGYIAWPSPPGGIGGTVKGFTSPASPNIDPARLSRSPYIPQFDTLPRGGLATNWNTTPKGTALALASTVNIGTPGATTPSRYYHNGDLTLGGPTIQYLKINGPVILYINGDLFISNPNSIGRIDISSTGSAEIHVSGEFKADAGGEGIVNDTKDPKKLIIISDTTSTSDHFYSEGVNPLYGVIYVPNTTSFNGYYNNNTNARIYGAVSAKKITYNGASINVHYDTQLRYTTFGGVDQPYGISEWRELPAAERAAL